MSPSAAYASPVCWFYAGLLVALLVLAGGLLAFFRWGLSKNVDHAWQSYRGWLFMLPPVFVAIFLGRPVVIVFFTALAIFGFKEFARATGLYRDWWMTGSVYLGIIAVGLTSLVHDPRLHVPGWYGLFMAAPVFVIAGILLIPILRNRSQGQLQLVALSILGFVYFGWMFGHLTFLANSKFAYSYLLYLLFAVELSDVAAFTVGRLFGRHQLRS